MEFPALVYGFCKNFTQLPFDQDFESGANVIIQTIPPHLGWDHASNGLFGAMTVMVCLVSSINCTKQPCFYL